MILETIVEDKKRKLPEHKKKIPLTEMRRLAEESQNEHHSFEEALRKPGISIIGECKKVPQVLDILKVNLIF